MLSCVFLASLLSSWNLLWIVYFRNTACTNWFSLLRFLQYKIHHLWVLFAFNPHPRRRFYWFLKREAGRERNINVIEKHQSVSSHVHPDQGSNPQPGRAHWLRIKPSTFCCTGWCFNPWSNPARATICFYESIQIKVWVLLGSPVIRTLSLTNSLPAQWEELIFFRMLWFRAESHEEGHLSSLTLKGKNNLQKALFLWHMHFPH